jgi:hypothetical protein
VNPWVDAGNNAAAKAKTVLRIVASMMLSGVEARSMWIRLWTPYLTQIEDFSVRIAAMLHPRNICSQS